MNIRILYTSQNMETGKNMWNTCKTMLVRKGHDAEAFSAREIKSNSFPQYCFNEQDWHLFFYYLLMI